MYIFLSTLQFFLLTLTLYPLPCYVQIFLPTFPVPLYPATHISSFLPSPQPCYQHIFLPTFLFSCIASFYLPTIFSTLSYIPTYIFPLRLPTFLFTKCFIKILENANYSLRIAIFLNPSFPNFSRVYFDVWFQCLSYLFPFYTFQHFSAFLWRCPGQVLGYLGSSYSRFRRLVF